MSIASVSSNPTTALVSARQPTRPAVEGSPAEEATESGAEKASEAASGASSPSGSKATGLIVDTKV